MKIPSGSADAQMLRVHSKRNFNQFCVEPFEMNTEEAKTAIDNGQTGRLAGETSSSAAEGHVEFISFSIGEDQYGVEIIAVREIKGWTNVTQLPRQPDYVRGVLNLRGVMVPIIDLRCRFGQGVTEASPMHVVIIVQIADKSVGILADRVLDIVSVETATIQPVPKVTRASQSDLLSGLVTTESAMIALIDLKYLVASEENDAPSVSAAAA